MFMAMSRRKMFSTAVITGASAGLGEEYALQLAGRAGHLVLVARRGELLESLAARIRAAHSAVAVTVMAADLADPSQRGSLAEALARSGLVPDLLVNNAGLGDYGEFATAEWPKLEQVLRVNIEALTHLSRLIAPEMIRAGGGAIMNISSLASLLPIPDFAVYAATKAYVSGFSEALRIELRQHGIEVMSVCPGPVHTGFGEVARRGGKSPDVPGRGWFYLSREQVVAESLQALDRGRVRVFPGLRTRLAALVISALPMRVLRAFLARRPYRM
jgi:short-subunit dehydrogenase